MEGRFTATELRTDKVSPTQVQLPFQPSNRAPFSTGKSNQRRSLELDSRGSRNSPDRYSVRDDRSSQGEEHNRFLARHAPRQLSIKEIGTPSSLPLPVSSPMREPSNSLLPVLSAAKVVEDTVNATSSSLQAMLTERLKGDLQHAMQQKEFEANIREELDQSKASLINKYKEVEISLKDELLATKQAHEKKLSEVDELWKERMQAKQEEVEALEIRMKQIVEDSNKKVANTEQRMINEFTKLENSWKERLIEAEEHNAAQMEALKAKHKLERDAKQLTMQAHLEAADERVKRRYEKKLRTYEQQVKEVIEAYKQKELVITGSLEEARRELLHVQNTLTAREQVLNEEMTLKDKRMVAMQAQLHAVDEITRIAEVWRGQARELASVIIQACLTVRDLPEVPEAPKDLLSSVFQGFVKEEELQKHRRHYFSDVRVYNRLKADHVMVQKDFLAKALKNSKV